MEEAIIGFCGVLVGSALTVGADWLRQRMATKKEAIYLAIQISVRLERFAIGCADVVRDDGLYNGETDESGCRIIRIDPPTLDLYLVDINWQSLPATLMDELIFFPMEIETAKSFVSSVSENSCPPDYAELFEERKYQYSILGEKAYQLAAKLRIKTGLLPRISNEWSSEIYFRERRLEIEASRVKRVKQYSVPVKAS